MAAKLSPALQAKLDAIRKKAAAQQVQAQAPALESKVTAPAAGPVPTPQSHVVKPSLVRMEGAGEYEPFKMKLAELEQQLNEQVPGFATTLRDIHREMATDPNVVTILSDEEISIIVQGLARHMDTTVVVAKKSSSKRTQPLTIDEL